MPNPVYPVLEKLVRDSGLQREKTICTIVQLVSEYADDIECYWKILQSLDRSLPHFGV